MNLLSDLIPTELTNLVDEMVCKRCTNGDQKSNDLILTFGMTEKATNVHDTLMQWLLRCLDKISDKVYRDGQYQWNIISQIKDNDCKETGNDTEQKHIRESPIINTIMVAIHIKDNSFMSWNHDGMTIPYNYRPELTLLPSEIMDCLTNEPVFINKIGVSSVSSVVIMNWWQEMISTEQKYLDIAGKGYMVHPMWIKIKDVSTGNISENWMSISERSCNFGWKGYSN